MYYNLITHISNNILCKDSEILVRDKIEVGYAKTRRHPGVGWQQVNSLFRTAFCSCAIKC